MLSNSSLLKISTSLLLSKKCIYIKKYIRLVGNGNTLLIGYDTGVGSIEFENSIKSFFSIK